MTFQLIFGSENCLSSVIVKNVLQLMENPFYLEKNEILKTHYYHQEF